MRKFGIVAALIVLLSVGAQAQWPVLPGPGLPVASGGGGASIANLFTATTDSCTYPCTIVSGVTFSAGVAEVGVAYDVSGGNTAVGGVTIKGVTATQCGTTVTDAGNNGVAMFYAVVTAGTGSIVLTGTGGLSIGAVNGNMITGNASNTPTCNQDNGFSVQQPDPQGPVTLTGLSSGSVEACVLGRNFPGSQNPTSWTGVTRVAAQEATSATSNGIIIAGGNASSLSGTVNATATGTASWQYSGMVCGAWH